MYPTSDPFLSLCLYRVTFLEVVFAFMEVAKFQEYISSKHESDTTIFAVLSLCPDHLITWFPRSFSIVL